MYFIAMTDIVAAQLINAAITMLGTILTGVLTYLMARLKLQQENQGIIAADQRKEAAKEVKEVKETLAVNGETTAKKLDTIHTLVNGNMGVQLQLNMTVTRRLAQVTNDAIDIEAANLAEEMFRKHQATEVKSLTKN